MSSEENKNPLYGKTWTNGKTYDSYDRAVSEKAKIEEESTDLAVKIRRTSENRFLIKTRSTVVPAAKKKESQKNTAKTRSQRKKQKAAKHKARQEKE